MKIIMRLMLVKPLRIRERESKSQQPLPEKQTRSLPLPKRIWSTPSWSS